MKRFLVEIEIVGLNQHLYRLQEKLVPLRLDTTADIFVYSVLQEDPKEPSEFQKITLNGYESLAQVERVIWALAQLCPPAHYWLITDLGLPTVEYWLREGVLTPDLLEANQWTPRDSEVLIRLDWGQRLPIEPFAGTVNHARIFRFLGLPSDSSDHLLLEQVCLSVGRYKRALRGLIWNTDLVLADTVLEVSPYGEEEVDYVGIKLTPWLSREVVRQVVEAIYQLPFLKVQRSVEQFMWEDDVDWVDLSEWGLSLED